MGYFNCEECDKCKIWDGYRTTCLEECMKPLNALDEYKEYKRLEEQGLLLKLPCKVGSTVYHIMNNTDACLECPNYSDFYGVDSMCSKDKGNTVFEPRWQDEPVCNDHFYEISEMTTNLDYIVRHLNDFGKTVFLTKEEAEQALKQMGE